MAGEAGTIGSGRGATSCWRCSIGYSNMLECCPHCRAANVSQLSKAGVDLLHEVRALTAALERERRRSQNRRRELRNLHKAHDMLWKVLRIHTEEMVKGRQDEENAVVVTAVRPAGERGT